MKRKRLDAGFTFNPANFARAGEQPFGKSFKSQSIRFVDGLDVEDSTFDGSPTELARGHAEIKEMISNSNLTSNNFE